MHTKDSGLTFAVADSITDLPPDQWNALFNADCIEGYGFHKTLEESGLKEFTLRYLTARRNARLTAILPFFTTLFSFTTIIQGPLQKMILALQKRFPGFLTMKIMFVGAPTAERLYLGLSNDEEKHTLLSAALKELWGVCRAEKIGLLLFYNLTGEDAALAASLKRCGFCRMENYPGTVIELDFPSLEEYFAKRLGHNTRKDLRRKLKQSAALAKLTTEIREDLDGIDSEVYQLYLNNLKDSEVSFEKLTPEFFRQISRNMPGIAKYFITRDKEKIVAFNLCFIENETCIDKFVGFDKEVAHQYHLYYTTFCHNIDWCIKNGIRYYHMGITDYEPKLRLGAKLIPLFVYVKLRNPVMNFFAKWIIPFMEPKKTDPTLKKLKK